MKTGGIITLVFGVLNLIMGIVGLSTEYAEKATGKIGLGSGATILGFYLLNRANQQKEEEEKKKQWENQSSQKDENKSA